MTNLVLHRESSQAIALPEPRVGGPISIRVGALDDIKFVDALQKKHSKMVGFLFMEVLETRMKAGHVLIAEHTGSPPGHQASGNSAAAHAYCPMPNASPVGYCIFQDKYDKHDDVGIFFQVNIEPVKQRGLIGAALVKTALDRAAYGCKLACCWCAQDLEANYFWESLGFVPLAFRTGSEKVKRMDGTVGPRIHIFWQRRIREGDDSTPYWYPAVTNNGAVKAERIALPIPPGTHWSDAKPAVLPGMEEALKALPAPGPLAEKKPREKKAKTASEGPAARPPSRGVWVAPPAPPAPPPLTKEQIAAEKKAARARARAERGGRPRQKNDPKLVAAARELRDRYIEQINAGLLLPPSANGKYDVSRQLEAAPSAMKQTPLLKAAA